MLEMFRRHIPEDVQSVTVYTRPKFEVKSELEIEMWKPTVHK